MEEREKRERYIDIVNVHAAAQNANCIDERPYRSLDALEKTRDDEDQMMAHENFNSSFEPLNGSKQYLMANDDHFFRAEDLTIDDKGAAISESGHYTKSVRRKNFLKLWLSDQY